MSKQITNGTGSVENDKMINYTNEEGGDPILFYDFKQKAIIEFFPATYVIQYWDWDTKQYVPYMDLEGGNNMHGLKLTIPDSDDSNLRSVKEEGIFMYEVQEIIDENLDASLQEFEGLVKQKIRRIEFGSEFEETQKYLREAQRRHITEGEDKVPMIYFVKVGDLEEAMDSIKFYVAKRRWFDDRKWSFR